MTPEQADALQRIVEFGELQTALERCDKLAAENAALREAMRTGVQFKMMFDAEVATLRAQLAEMTVTAENAAVWLARAESNLFSAEELLRRVMEYTEYAGTFHGDLYQQIAAYLRERSGVGLVAAPVADADSREE